MFLTAADLHKLEEWRTLLASDLTPEDWLDSSSGSSDEDDDDEDSEGEESESPMDTDWEPRLAYRVSTPWGLLRPVKSCQTVCGYKKRELTFLLW